MSHKRGAQRRAQIFQESFGKFLQDIQSGLRSNRCAPIPVNANSTNGIATDSRLLARLKDWRDDASWEEFFRLYRGIMHEFARRQGLNEQEAQDVVQDTLLSVARYLHAFKHDASRCSFRRWLLRIVRNRTVDLVRRRPNERSFPGRWPGADSGTGTAPIDRVPDLRSLQPGERWERQWEAQVLEAALEKLKRQVKPRHYQVFDLAVLQHNPTKRVARTLGISPTQVYLVKHRVLRAFKQMLEKLQAGLR